MGHDIFSLDDFIQKPDNYLINGAIAQEKQQLANIFQGACHLQKRFKYRIIWPGDKIEVDSQRNQQGNSSVQKFDATFIRDCYPNCLICRLGTNTDERVSLRHVYLCLD